jgi:hypothetical protein
MRRKVNTKIIRQVFGIAILLTVAMVASADAERITKSFELGAGTAYQVSNRRTFNVPCGRKIVASVEFHRLGAADAANDVPIVIELKKPGAAATEEGLKGKESNRGCSLPWIVKVKLAGGQSQVAVNGTISVSYDHLPQGIDVEGGLISLNKGNQVTKNVGGASGLDQGTLVVTATWLHAIGPVPGPLPVRLKFELIDPNGNVVASDTGFAGNEINPCCSGDKMKITFRVTSCAPGQWKLRITNNTNDDTMNIDPKVRLKPDCPN